MKFKDNMESVNKKCGCSPKYLELVSDYSDNKLSGNEIVEIENHLNSCSDCREIYELSLLSHKLTDKLIVSKNEYISRISNEDIDFKTDNIMKAIIAESIVDASFVAAVPAQAKSSRWSVFSIYDGKKFNGFFNKRINRSFAGVAAGFVVLFSVAYLFGIFGNNSIIPAFNKNKMSTQTDDNAYYGSSSFTDRSGMAEIATKEATGSAKDANGSNNYPEQSSVIDKDMVSSTIISGGADTSFEPSSSIIIDSFLTAEQTAAFYEATADSIAFIQGQTPEYKYVGIYAFASDLVNDRKSQIDNIFSNYSKPVKIEIISGENSQKLLEYTTKENTGYLQKSTEGKNADFLIILIGR